MSAAWTGRIHKRVHEQRSTRGSMGKEVTGVRRYSYRFHLCRCSKRKMKQRWQQNKKWGNDLAGVLHLFLIIILETHLLPSAPPVRNQFAGKQVGELEKEQSSDKPTTSLEKWGSCHHIKESARASQKSQSGPQFRTSTLQSASARQGQTNASLPTYPSIQLRNLLTWWCHYRLWCACGIVRTCE